MTDQPIDEKAVFNRARQIAAPEERLAYLQAACGQDLAALRRIQELLRVYDQEKSFLESPAAELRGGRTVDEPVSEKPGAVIGPYKLLQQIGEGGMGAVWMAQQTEPVKRLVALKLIKAGMDSKQVIARFEAERQALALMDHVNIARVLDGGTTSSGRPYFVMDLVKGVPITRYCDEHHLTPRQRLELFIPVCQAVQHAHQKGIIHRDLKPSNVLVALYDGKPVPKVIDFGVAKAAGQPLTDRTLVTGFGNIVGTLEYMSPEQAEVNQLDIDTRSDIYSLGVLLYELLTGSPPFSRKELTQAGMLEMLRVIREQEPSKPSTKLSTAEGLPTLAANRGTEPARLCKLVRGEPDWIVMKALEKERTRRYETANGFAQDVQRYLNDEPVQACPPSAGYRLRKFMHRNRGPVIAACALVLALVAGMSGTTLGLIRAMEAEGETGKTLLQVASERDAKEKARREAVENATRAARERDAKELARKEAVGHAETAKKEKKAAEEERDRAKFQALRAADAKHAIQMLLVQRAVEKGDLKEAERVLGESDDAYRHTWEQRHLQSLGRPLTLGSASEVAFSRDGKRILTHGVLRDAVTGREQLRLWRDSHYPAALSPDGKWVASAGDTTGQLILWDAQTGQKKLTVKLAGARIRRVAYSPDGKWLATACSDGAARLCDAQTGDLKRLLRVLPAAKGVEADMLNSVAFSADGKYLAAGGPWAPVRVWETDSGAEKKVSFGGGTQGLAFSPDGHRLAVAPPRLNEPVRVLDLESGKETVALKVSAALYEVTCVAFSRDGRRLATGDDLGVARVWDLASGRELFTFTSPAVNPRAVAFSPDGRRLAVAGGKAVVWELERGSESLALPRPRRPVHLLAFSPDGKWIASAGDTHLLIQGGGDEPPEPAEVRVFDAQTGVEKRIITGALGDIHALAFSPDGRRLVTAALDAPEISRARGVQVWDLQTGEKRLAFDNGIPPTCCLAFSADGRFIATGNREGVVRIWDAASGEQKRFWQAHKLQVLAVAWSADGRLLSAGSDDGAVKRWDAQTGDEELTIATGFPRYDEGRRSGFLSVAFSSAGLVATGGIDGTVKLWDAQSGEKKFTLKTHKGAGGFTRGVRSLAFSPDGRRLVSAAHAQAHRASELKVWDTTTGQEKLILKGPAWVETVAFSGDGRRIAASGGSAGENNPVLIWDAPP